MLSGTRRNPWPTKLIVGASVIGVEAQVISEFADKVDALRKVAGPYMNAPSKERLSILIKPSH